MFSSSSIWWLVMVREFSTLDEELARLRTGAAAPEYLESKRELYEQQVTKFAALLLPDVEKFLQQEATSKVAEEWLAEANQTLKAIVPELPQSVQTESDFRAALMQLRIELSQSLPIEMIAPDAQEISTHAHELAQLVLGNWFSILEDAQYDSCEAIPLTVNGLPNGVDHADVYEGIETFVVPKERVVSHFTNYLRSLTSSEHMVQLTPSRILVTREQERFLFCSRQAAENFVEVKNPKWVRVELNTVSDALMPIIDSLPAIFGRSKAANVGTLTERILERNVAIAAAFQAAHHATVRLEALTATTEIAEIFLLESQATLSKDLAEYAVLDLKQTIDQGALPKLWLRTQQMPIMRKLRAEAAALINKQSLDPLRRVSVAAVGYAVSGAAEQTQLDDFDAAAVENFVRESPQNCELFAISVRAAQLALAHPENTMLAEEFRSMLGDENV